MTEARSRGRRAGKLLRVEGLTVRFHGRSEPVLADVSFSVAPDERVGIVGPSGAGKTLLLLALLGLLPRRAGATGRVLWGGEDLLAASTGRRRQVRGREIGLIFQAPATALHPLHRVDRQVAEAVSAHASRREPVLRQEALSRAQELLLRVGIEPAGDGGWPFPHELSGGQRQRALAAVAVVNRPELLLADEPTTALDTITQARLLVLLESLRREVGASLLLVSHDLEVVAEVTDRVVRLERGRIVRETGLTALARARPSSAVRPAASSARPLLVVEGLRAEYRRRRFLRPPVVHVAVDGVDLAVRPAETVALVGASGAGKSTLARVLLGLQPVAAGRILLGGTDLVDLHHTAWRKHRRRLQIVFQDPGASLNPKRRVDVQVAAALRRLGLADAAQARRTALDLLERGGLEPGEARRLPHELSTGQQQRVCIARALAPRPDLVVLDEPVSALDRRTRSQILELLHELQQESGTAYLLITHDLGVVRDVADRVVVMQRGRKVEEGLTASVLGGPEHAHTRELLAAVPRGDGRMLAAFGP